MSVSLQKNSALVEEKHNFSLLRCGLCTATVFQRVSHGKRGKRVMETLFLEVKTPEKYHMG